jgi:hypothetical protein
MQRRILPSQALFRKALARRRGGRPRGQAHCRVSMASQPAGWNLLFDSARPARRKRRALPYMQPLRRQQLQGLATPTAGRALVFDRLGCAGFCMQRRPRRWRAGLHERGTLGRLPCLLTFHQDAPISRPLPMRCRNLLALFRVEVACFFLGAGTAALLCVSLCLGRHRRNRPVPTNSLSAAQIPREANFSAPAAALRSLRFALGCGGRPPRAVPITPKPRWARTLDQPREDVIVSTIGSFTALAGRLLLPMADTELVISPARRVVYRVGAHAQPDRFKGRPLLARSWYSLGRLLPTAANARQESASGVCIHAGISRWP